MSILKNPLFIGIFALSLGIYLAKIIGLILPSWIHNYLSNVLCMPLVLSLCLVVVRMIHKNNSLFVPMGAVIGLTLYYALYFEWWLPQNNTRYTTDIIDVVLYIVGSALFYIFQKKIY